MKARGHNKQHQEITVDDLMCAVKKLKIFGNGFRYIPIGGGKWMIQSVPGELSMDQTAVLKLLSSSARPFVTLTSLIERLDWEKTRALNTVNQMISEGLCWVDEQDAETSFWFPSMFTECISSLS